jgi:hypothetical protein
VSAAVTAALLIDGRLVLAALTALTRTVISVASTPPRPTATAHRWMAYNPEWLGGVVLHIGDTVILAGIGAHLQMAGHPVWGGVAVASALYGLAATYVRLAAHQEGVRLPRLWIDRGVKDVSITGAIAAAAILGRAGWPEIPAFATAVAAVAFMATVELVRVRYFVRHHDRQARRAATVDGARVADAVVFKTDNDLVYRIPLSGRRRRVFDRPRPASSSSGRSGRDLHVVRADAVDRRR